MEDRRMFFIPIILVSMALGLGSAGVVEAQTAAEPLPDVLAAPINSGAVPFEPNPFQGPPPAAAAAAPPPPAQPQQRRESVRATQPPARAAQPVAAASPARAAAPPPAAAPAAPVVAVQAFGEEASRAIKVATGTGRSASLRGPKALGTMQRSWENPEQFKEQAQCAPGVMCYEWSERFVMTVRARIFLTTYVELPSWEEVADIDYIGQDDPNARTLRVERVGAARNIVKVTASHFDQDGNFLVIGKSGRSYLFHVMVVDTKEELLSDEMIRVQGLKPADWRAVPVKQEKAGSEAIQSLRKPENKEYLRDVKIDFEKMDCDDFDVYVKDDKSESIKPAGVCHDQIFTIIDFGENSDSIKAVTAYEVVDRIDSKIDTHWAGKRGQLLILHTVSENVTLGNGEKVVCLRKRSPIIAERKI